MKNTLFILNLQIICYESQFSIYIIYIEYTKENS